MSVQDERGFHDRKKPPIGVVPRKQFLEKRLRELCEATVRYLDAGLQPPPEWAEEAHKISTELSE